MNAYELVGSAWDAKIQKNDLEGYLRRARDCQAAQDVLSRAAGEKYGYVTLEVYAVPTLMGCASEKLAALGSTVDDLAR